MAACNSSKKSNWILPKCFSFLSWYIGLYHSLFQSFFTISEPFHEPKLCLMLVDACEQGQSYCWTRRPIWKKKNDVVCVCLDSNYKWLRLRFLTSSFFLFSFLFFFFGSSRTIWPSQLWTVHSCTVHGPTNSTFQQLFH